MLFIDGKHYFMYNLNSNLVVGYTNVFHLFEHSMILFYTFMIPILRRMGTYLIKSYNNFTYCINVYVYVDN